MRERCEACLQRFNQRIATTWCVGRASRWVFQYRIILLAEVRRVLMVWLRLIALGAC